MRQGAAHARAIGSPCGLEGPRADWRVPVRIGGPTREVSNPRANKRAHVRGEERRQLARSEQFRMQFD